MPVAAPVVNIGYCSRQCVLSCITELGKAVLVVMLGHEIRTLGCCSIVKMHVQRSCYLDSMFIQDTLYATISLMTSPGHVADVV